MKRLPYLWIVLENLEIHGEISATIKKGGPNYLKSQKLPVVGQSRLLTTKGGTPSKGRNYEHWGICRCIYTSSTAQGGGGSFKNRKPIGELGCCESGMAERSH